MKPNIDLNYVVTNTDGINAEKDQRRKSQSLGIRRLIRYFLLAGMICFFMPFCMVSCEKTEVMKLTGAELGLGFTYMDQQSTPNIFLLLALLFAFIGIVTTLIKKGRIASTILSFFAAISLILFVIDLTLKTREQDNTQSPVIRIIIEYGWFLSLISFIIASLAFTIVPLFYKQDDQGNQMQYSNPRKTPANKMISIFSILVIIGCLVGAAIYNLDYRNSDDSLVQLNSLGELLDNINTEDLFADIDTPANTNSEETDAHIGSKDNNIAINNGQRTTYEDVRLEYVVNESDEDFNQEYYSNENGEIIFCTEKPLDDHGILDFYPNAQFVTYTEPMSAVKFRLKNNLKESLINPIVKLDFDEMMIVLDQYNTSVSAPDKCPGFAQVA